MGNPPEGYLIGTEFTREQIDEAIKQPTVPMRMQIVPSVDVSGHGTSVAGIAAGNGRGSRGRIYRGVATQSELMVDVYKRQEQKVWYFCSAFIFKKCLLFDRKWASIDAYSKSSIDF